jgi:hypothetical protein
MIRADQISGSTPSIGLRFMPDALMAEPEP